jgi:hypothetical protein
LAYAYFLNKEKEKSLETLKKAQSFDPKGVNAEQTFKNWKAKNRGKVWIIALIITVLLGIIICNLPR